MRSMVFCKVSAMKYYKGACKKDVPYNGGSFVAKNGYGHEEYNFLERYIEGWEDDSGALTDGDYCLGFVETKQTVNGKFNQLHIEKIAGCAAMKNGPCVSGIDVIWCATTDLNETSVVGWYYNATVYRNYQGFTDENGKERAYNVLALSSECVLLPYGLRHERRWHVPSKKYTKAFGFGQSMLWYAGEEKAAQFLNRLSENIETYSGENWITKYPDD